MTGEERSPLVNTNHKKLSNVLSKSPCNPITGDEVAQEGNNYNPKNYGGASVGMSNTPRNYKNAVNND